MPQSLFCFGFGYVAQYLAPHITAQDGLVWGTKRDVKPGAPLFVYHGNEDLPDDARDALAQAESMLISIPPDLHGCPVARNIDDFLSDKDNLQWVGYLSTTGVYGHADGDWVDELSPTQPTSDRAAQRVLAEDQWLQWGLDNNIPVHIFRLSGIYGPGRSPFDKIAKGDTQIIHAPGHVFNRIHVADIINVLLASMDYPDDGAIYNVSDDLPASQQDVMQFAFGLLQEPAPLPVDLDDADLSPMAEEFYRDTKRVCNEKIKNALGVTLRYPTFQEGLVEILADHKPNSGARTT